MVIRLGAVVLAVPNDNNIMVMIFKRVIFRGAKWCIRVVQSPSHVHFFATPWTAAHQASQSPTIWSLPRFKSNALLMPSSHLILWNPLLLLPSLSFPASGTFPMSSLFSSGDQNTGASTSSSVLPMSIQGWFPLRLTGLVSKESQESSLTPQLEDTNTLALCLL